MRPDPDTRRNSDLLAAEVRRLPEGVWSHVKENQALFEFLDNLEVPA